MTKAEKKRDWREKLKHKMRESKDDAQLYELEQEWERLDREEKREQIKRVELDRGKPRKGEELGPILNTLTNVIRILTEDPQWLDVLAYNERSRKLMLMKAPPFIGSEQTETFPRPLRDVDITQARAWIDSALIHSLAR